MDINLDSFFFDSDSQEGDASISGYVAKQLKAKAGQCWSHLLIGDAENREYLDFYQEMVYKYRCKL